VARRGDTLIAQPEGDGVSVYIADGPLSFSGDTPDERLRCEAGPDGRITRLVVHTGGADTPAERIAD
jgi:hypothetical protein